MSAETNNPLAALKANGEMTGHIVTSATTMMDDLIASMRRRTEQLAKRGARRSRPEMPPPVASMLHGFSRALAEKIEGINMRLPREIRERLRAVVPGFVRAVLSNDSDVVQLFVALLAATPDEVAHWLVEQVDLLEQRFAS